MKIYKYKVAITAAYMWFVASVLFSIIPAVWQIIVTMVLAVISLLLLFFEHESRRKETLKAVGAAFMLLFCNGYILIVYHHL